MTQMETAKPFPWQKLFLYAAALFFLYVFIALVQDLIAPAIVSVFLAFILNPVVDALERKGAPRMAGILLLYVVFILSVAVFGVLLKNVLVSQVRHFQENFPAYKEKTHALIERGQEKVNAYRRSLGLPETEQKKPSATEQNETMSRVLQSASAQVFNVLSFLPNLFLIPLMTFFFLKDGRAVKKLLVSFVPNKYFELSLTLLYEVGAQIGMYIRGQLSAALIVGILFTAGLAALKVPYFFLLGPFAGISNVIPYVGPVMGFASSALVVLVTQDAFSLNPILYITILTLAVQTLDSLLISPLVVGKSVDMHPLVIIFALLAGGKAMGLVGMLVAVPAASSVKVIFYVSRERLKDFQVA